LWIANCRYCRTTNRNHPNHDFTPWHKRDAAGVHFALQKIKTKKLIMKLKLLFILGLTVLACIESQGQTTNTTPPATFASGVQTIYDSLAGSTNWGGAFGFARATTGNKSVGFADALYNFNSTVGALVGYEYLYSGNVHTANLVKGGLNLQADLQPLKQFGFTNFTVTPFAFALVASGNGVVSEIVGGGAKTKIYQWANGIAINAVVLYENRTGSGYWDGRYVGGALAITYKF
jgi:hypothetical protein